MILHHPNVIHPLGYMPVGWSFFYPTYDPTAVEAEITRLAVRSGVSVSFKTGVEHGLFGVRVYRIA